MTDDADRAGMLFRVFPTSHPEPAVSNQDFLQSFVRYGCWLRTAAASNCRRILSDKGTSELDRYAAVCSFYQTVGMMIEDVVTALVVWAAWAKDRSLWLADLNEKLIISEGQDRKDKSVPYRVEVIDRLTKQVGKRIRVDPATYLSSLFELSNEDVLRWLGIPWKRNPSVKMVARTDFDKWHTLPDAVEILRAFAGSPKCQLLATCYNKLKHGPQFVVSSIRNSLIVRGDKNAHMLPNTSYVRLLLNGAKTDDPAEPFVAPFLLHEPYFVNGMFYERILPLAVITWDLANWLLTTNFTKCSLERIDRQMDALRRECRDWKQRNMLLTGDEAPDILKMAAKVE